MFGSLSIRLIVSTYFGFKVELRMQEVVNDTSEHPIITLVSSCRVQMRTIYLVLTHLGNYFYLW